MSARAKSVESRPASHPQVSKSKLKLETTVGEIVRSFMIVTRLSRLQGGGEEEDGGRLGSKLRGHAKLCFSFVFPFPYFPGVLIITSFFSSFLFLNLTLGRINLFCFGSVPLRVG